MGALGVFTYTNFVIAAAGVVALFCVKKAAKLVFGLMSVFCVALGVLAYTAQPINYAGSQALAFFAIAVVAVAVVLRFVLKKSIFLAKLLLCGSALVSLMLLFG